MTMDEAIGMIEDCGDVAELPGLLQGIIETWGFAAYCFLDIGKPHIDVPYYVGTTGSAWEIEYQHNGFIQVDEVIRKARRTNTPFRWSDTPLPKRLGQKKPGALKTMQAAADYGFKEGLVIPFHFVDGIGRVHSSLCSLIWTDSVAGFRQVTETSFQQLHLILIYWMQRSIDLRTAAVQAAGNVVKLRDAALEIGLTDRERDVLAWAARGKTTSVTAEILRISPKTVEVYAASAIEKLGAGNRTHAVAMAIKLGLIDL